MLRYELKTIEQSLFWEISKIAYKDCHFLLIFFGDFGNLPKVTILAFLDEKKCQNAYHRRIKLRESKGYQLASELATLSKPALAKNPLLENNIAFEDTQENWLVYADWLQMQADARGVLINLWLADLDPHNPEVIKQFIGLQSFENYLFWAGESLTKLLLGEDISTVYKQFYQDICSQPRYSSRLKNKFLELNIKRNNLQLVWKHGFIMEATLESIESAYMEWSFSKKELIEQFFEYSQALFSSPAISLLRQLHIRYWLEHIESFEIDKLTALFQYAPYPALERLTFSIRENFYFKLSQPLYQLFPNLRYITFSLGAEVDFYLDNFIHEKLQQLIIEPFSYQNAFHFFLDQDVYLPALKTLAVDRLNSFPFAVLTKKSLPSLKKLTIFSIDKKSLQHLMQQEIFADLKELVLGDLEQGVCKIILEHVDQFYHLKKLQINDEDCKSLLKKFLLPI